MPDNKEQFYKKFRIEELSIHSTKFWTWSLRPKQSTLGASILSVKRCVEHFSDISISESRDIVNIVRIIEKTLKNVFDFDKMNYLMLMMVDTQLHYHVIPRYSKVIKFNNIEWFDYGWPSIPELSKGDLSDEVLLSIKNTLINNLRI